ncbi:MAG: hypothetical protein O3A63_09290 [Proteobacteria bacterium]|nr:hypothetical protein [Pseudomonadota bacterium]
MDEPLPLSRHSHCASCGEALHCCRQCTRFDRNSSSQCSERDADPPNDKAMANFCDWFNLRATGATTDANPDKRSALDDLFDRPSSSDATPSAADKLNDLFK